MIYQIKGKTKESRVILSLLTNTRSWVIDLLLLFISRKSLVQSSSCKQALFMHSVQRALPWSHGLDAEAVRCPLLQLPRGPPVKFMPGNLALPKSSAQSSLKMRTVLKCFNLIVCSPERISLWKEANLF